MDQDGGLLAALVNIDLRLEFSQPTGAQKEGKMCDKSRGHRRQVNAD
jgi:hypothetical protein